MPESERVIYKLSIKTDQGERTNLLIAHLDQLGVEAFEEKDRLIIVYNHDPTTIADYIKFLKSHSSLHSLETEVCVLPDTNWNKLWEKSYEPVIIDDFCSIRASFHNPITTTRYELIIDPEMAFGTAHHETTFLMIKAMRSLPVRGKSVLDAGCGTGLLAILAYKMSAAHVEAFDNDEKALAATKKNMSRNGIKDIVLTLCTPDALPEDHHDIILANINRQVLLDYSETFSQKMKDGSLLVLSGFLTADEDKVTETYHALGLTLQSKQTKGHWCCLIFDK